MDAAAEIDARIKELIASSDWRGNALARVRELIRQADPQVVEEVKWRKPSNPAGVPVWAHDGLICTGETYRDKVKLTFARGAALDDPAGPSTPASMALPAAPSTSAKARRSTRERSKPSSALRRC